MEYKDYLLWAISGSGGSSATKYVVTYNGEEGGLLLPGEDNLAISANYYPESIVIINTDGLYLHEIRGDSSGINYGTGEVIGTDLYMVGMPQEDVTITASTTSPK